MKRQWRSHRSKHRWQHWGFTLIEVMVIVMAIGILSAVAAPSFGTLLDNIKVSQTTADLRLALQDTQRQAIRANKTCNAKLAQQSKNHGQSKKNRISGDCLTSGNPDVPDELSIANNIKVDSSKSNGNTAVSVIKFNPIGSAEFNVVTTVQPPNLPTDSSGKMVIFVPTKSKVKMKCVAISSTLGLTRIGTYTGDISPTAITDQGICTALDWKQQ